MSNQKQTSGSFCAALVALERERRNLIENDDRKSAVRLLRIIKSAIRALEESRKKGDKTVEELMRESFDWPFLLSSFADERKSQQEAINALPLGKKTPLETKRSPNGGRNRFGHETASHIARDLWMQIESERRLEQGSLTQEEIDQKRSEMEQELSGNLSSNSPDYQKTTSFCMAVLALEPLATSTIRAWAMIGRSVLLGELKSVDLNYVPPEIPQAWEDRANAAGGKGIIENVIFQELCKGFKALIQSTKNNS